MNNDINWLMKMSEFEDKFGDITIISPDFKRIMSSTWFPISMALLDETQYIVYIEDSDTKDYYIGKGYYDIEEDSWCAESFGIHKCPLNTPKYFSHLPELPNKFNIYEKIEN